MTFKERLQQIELAEKQAAPQPEGQVPDEPAEAPPPPYSEEGTPVRCSECGHNTFREEHNAIMCATCSHGPFCNYCWEVHIREFHPLLADSYNDARRGIRRKARFLNHHSIRTIVKPVGIALSLAALLAVAYFGFWDQRPPDEPVVRELTDAAQLVDASRDAPATTQANARVDVAAPPADALVTPPGHAAATTSVDSSTRTATSASLNSASVEGPESPRPTTSASGLLELELVAVTSPVHRRNDASLQIRTAPGAACTIEVRYRSGPSKAHALGPQVADAAGQVTWTWRIGGQTSLGTWPVHVACTLKDQEGSLSTAITVSE